MENLIKIASCERNFTNVINFEKIISTVKPKRLVCLLFTFDLRQTYHDKEGYFPHSQVMVTNAQMI